MSPAAQIYDPSDWKGVRLQVESFYSSFAPSSAELKIAVIDPKLT